MRLSWNEIRVRAARFAEDWKNASYEKGETQSYYNDFFEVFGVNRRRVAAFEAPVKKLGDRQGFIDLFWKGMLLVEQKSAGRNLSKARAQAFDYFPGLREDELPRFLLLSDFQTFELIDLETGEEFAFPLTELSKHVEKFGFIVGAEKRTFKDQDPVNIKAAEKVGALHDALEASGYIGHDLERFLVRIVFCLFADDTGIFQRDIFLQFLETRTREDGSDLGGWLAHLFQVLDTPEIERQSTLDEDLDQFPYVNGGLFEGSMRIPNFDADMREKLLEASRFNWSPISPAIFGSLFQSVMAAEERRAQGAHYTTEKNIMKVIEPLFLDDLRAEFAKISGLRSGKTKRLEAFHKKLGALTFFDPACGCGNFLIISYRELRMLELAVLAQIYAGGQKVLDAQQLSVVDVDQFFGIEIGEFPALIAETAMWMMDHIMNEQLSQQFGQVFTRIPLKKSAKIVHGDALDVDWDGVLPRDQCSFVLGNPPFIGQSFQSKEQRAQMRLLTNPKGKSASPLDFVGAWFLKAGAYAVGKCRIGFVSTNSITQGEQVALLWPKLFDEFGLEISFAHRTFAWGSDARGKAHVHVVVLGLDRRENAPQERRLFSYENINEDPEETRHAALSPYLFDASGMKNPHLVVKDCARPLSPRPRMMRGVQSTDGGHLIFRGDEYAAFLALEPQAKKFLRPYIGAAEFLQGKSRWILFLDGIEPGVLKSMPHVAERVKRVKAFRAASKKPATQRLADFPTRLEGQAVPTSDFLAVPQVSSERRDYVPLGWMKMPIIPSDKLRYIEDVDLGTFGVLTSSMHMAWMRTVTGRMKSDYMYSVGVVYNTFPLPEGKKMDRLVPLAQAVLDARSHHVGATLADLYDPNLMPPDLRRAHLDLDKAVDRLYRPSGFKSERDRVEALFALYEKSIAPIEAAAAQKPRRRRG